MNEIKGVSIVICCYNSSSRIKTTLEYLQEVKAKEISWEVILVDNNSNDDTSEKALTIWNSKPAANLKIVVEKTPGLMNARITGAQNSIYSIISFIDDDNWVDSSWVENVYKIIENNKDIGACGGDSEAVFDLIPPFDSAQGPPFDSAQGPPSWFNDFQMSFAVGKQQAETGYVSDQKGYLWGAGLTIRKSAWDDLFNTGYGSLLPGRKGKSLSAGEDSEICLALIQRGWKLWYDSSLKLKHFIPASRLNLNYLKGMYKGFGKAEVVLSIYRNQIASTGKKKLSWFQQSITSINQLLQSGFKSIFSSKNYRTKYQVFWVHDKAYTWELITSRGKFNRVQKQVAEAGFPKKK